MMMIDGYDHNERYFIMIHPIYQFSRDRSLTAGMKHIPYSLLRYSIIYVHTTETK